MQNTGFVKISRKLTESDLMRNPVSLSVFFVYSFARELSGW